MQTQYGFPMHSSAQHLELLHPSLWRASQLGRAQTRCVDTGYPPLTHELAGGGWPISSLIELMAQQAGIGEMRLIAPALAQVDKRNVMLIQPPHVPQIVGLAGLGVEPSNVILVKAKTSADILWATEQALRGGLGAVVLWATHARPESLRRLNLAAQSGETLFFVVRPLVAAQDPSPSPLRLTLRPAQGGIDVGFLKRRGPQRDEPLFLPLPNPINPARRTQLPIQPHSLPVSQTGTDVKIVEHDARLHEAEF